MDRATLVIDGVEITPAMVDAGVRVLHASGLVDYPASADALVVREVLRKALLNRKSGPQNSKADC